MTLLVFIHVDIAKLISFTVLDILLQFSALKSYVFHKITTFPIIYIYIFLFDKGGKNTVPD